MDFPYILGKLFAPLFVGAIVYAVMHAVKKRDLTWPEKRTILIVVGVLYVLMIFSAIGASSHSTSY